MLIEIFGCTGAGKSTLTRQILSVCRQQGADVWSSESFVLDQFRLNWVQGHLPRTLLMDACALIACLKARRTHAAFFRFAVDRLFHLPLGRFERLNLLRNVFKKIGIYEIIRSRSDDEQIILVDEGVIHAAHNLFVFYGVPMSLENLPLFVRLIPFPDVLVYLRQPEAVLIDRTIKRGHKRIHDNSQAAVADFVHQAVTTFAALAEYPIVRERLLLVDGDAGVTIAEPGLDNPQLYQAVEIFRAVLAGENEPLQRAIINPGQKVELEQD